MPGVALLLSHVPSHALDDGRHDGHAEECSCVRARVPARGMRGQGRRGERGAGNSGRSGQGRARDADVGGAHPLCMCKKKPLSFSGSISKSSSSPSSWNMTNQCTSCTSVSMCVAENDGDLVTRRPKYQKNH